MIEILESRPVTDHAQTLKTLNAFIIKIDRSMNVSSVYDFDMDTDVITIDIMILALSYHFKGELHAQTLTDLINDKGITYTANQLYATVRYLILNEIYVKIFSKPIDE